MPRFARAARNPILIQPCRNRGKSHSFSALGFAPERADHIQDSGFAVRCSVGLSALTAALLALHTDSGGPDFKTMLVLSNSATAPRICRTSLAVGLLSSPAERSFPPSSSITRAPKRANSRKSNSEATRSRAKRSALSTSTVRAPFAAMALNSSIIVGRPSSSFAPEIPVRWLPIGLSPFLDFFALAVETVAFNLTSGGNSDG